MPTEEAALMKLADFYRAHVQQKQYATTEFYQLGSEVIRGNESFQRWKGKVDLVFTSPPYFAAEGYADEPTQSAKKFPNYALWRDGFLNPTLETACEWLKPGGVLAWNIADTRVNGYMQPLESDSIRILERLGMKFDRTRKMLLARAPGSRKSRGTRKFAMPYKNSCLVGAQMYRYEPIFVFRKPI
jgi:DNA modification methylase